MDINKVGFQKSINIKSISASNEYCGSDNSYKGDKITMDTCNPSEMLGRSMVSVKKIAHNSAISENSEISTRKRLSKKLSQNINLLRDYMGKTRLTVKSIGADLLMKLSLLFQDTMPDETPEQAEIRYLLSHQYIDCPNGDKNIQRVTTQNNKELLKRIIKERKMEFTDIHKCFQQENTTEDIDAKTRMYDYITRDGFLLDKSKHMCRLKNLTAALVEKTNATNFGFIKELLADDILFCGFVPDIISYSDTENDLTAKRKMCDILAVNDIDATKEYDKLENRVNIIKAITDINFDFVNKLCLDEIIPKSQICDVLGTKSSHKNIQAVSDMYDSLVAKGYHKEKSENVKQIVKILQCTNALTKPILEKFFNDSVIPFEMVQRPLVGKKTEADFTATVQMYEKLLNEGFNLKSEEDLNAFVNILEYTTAETKTFLEKMYSDSIIPTEKIHLTVSKQDSQDDIKAKQEVYELCSNDKNIDAETFVQTLSLTNRKSLDYIKELYSNGLISSGYDISSYFDANKYTFETKKAVVKHMSANPQYTTDDIYNAVNGVRSLIDKCYVGTKYKGPYRVAVWVSAMKNSKLYNKMSEDEVSSTINFLVKLREQVLKNTEQYVSGANNASDSISIVDKFFVNNASDLFDLSASLDKESMDVLLHKRLNYVEGYIKNNCPFDSERYNFVKNFVNSVNVDGKPHSSMEKIDFVDLYSAYQNNYMDMNKLENMVESGMVDITGLKVDLFNKVIKNIGLSDDEISCIPKDKLISWDYSYVHCLSKAVQNEKDVENKKSYIDLIRAANLYDFNSFITDESNVFGQVNSNTKNMYESLNIDYDKWLNPPKTFEKNFVSKDKNKEKLSQIADKIADDINSLMNSPVKGYIKKQFPEFVKGDEFFIPAEYLANASKLNYLLNSFIDADNTGKMHVVWNRAKNNLNSTDSDKTIKAQNTLTVLEHLNQRLTDLENLKSSKSEQSINWKIKMWDRVPQKDLFQGNYSTCCIGVSQSNGSAMPHYLLNTAFNMIEFVDNETGKTKGNALCYFVQGADGKPVFVIDNIEINYSVIPSDETSIKLRNAIVEYASNIAAEITGDKNTQVFLGTSYNDINVKDLTEKPMAVKFVGDIDCDKIYLDMYGGWVYKSNFDTKRPVFKLK